MNGTSHRHPDFEPGGSGLDPRLIQLFEAADTPRDPEAFVGAMLEKLRTARRKRFFQRCLTIVIFMSVGALLAPFVAQATLIAASWLAERLPDTVLALASCVCAALLAWRIARRQLS